MNYFQYKQPESLEEALRLRAEFGASGRLLLGGTDLMVRIQKGHAEPAAVIDLKRVRDIGDTAETNGSVLRVGARTVLSRLVEDPEIREQFPALIEAASQVGSVQIRNRATLAGNICNASPAADTVPPLLVYRAVVELAGPEGRRKLPLEQFLLGPGKTACDPAELVTAVEIPLPEPPFGAAFARLTRRRGVDLATINMACALDSRGQALFAFGAAGPTALLVREDSGRLAAPDLEDREARRLLETLTSRTSPIGDIRAGLDYRTAMLAVLARRVLYRARRARGLSAGPEDPQAGL